jgi:putative hydrolase of the HAD superfamily
VTTDTSTRAAIFDGDDTLWRTEALYDRAREAARVIVSRSGADPKEWEARQRVIDVQNVAVYGFSSARFPASCLQAFREVCSESGCEIDADVERHIVHAAQGVFRNNPKRVPYATSVLRTLNKRGVRLALLTKGDPTVQADRIKRSGLSSFFERVEVVADKTPRTIRGVLKKLGVTAPNTWMIGNSLRSDIIPALEVGVRGIWIEAPVWEYERVDVRTNEALVHKVTEIRKVLKIIY